MQQEIKLPSMQTSWGEIRNHSTVIIAAVLKSTRRPEQAAGSKPEVKGLLPRFQASESLLRSFLFRAAQTERYKNPIKNEITPTRGWVIGAVSDPGQRGGHGADQKSDGKSTVLVILQESMSLPPLPAVSSRCRVSGNFASH